MKRIGKFFEIRSSALQTHFEDIVSISDKVAHPS